MPSGSLVTGATISLLAGLLYVYLGWRLSRRNVTHASYLAAVSFVTWWVALGAHTAITGVRSLLAAFGVLDVPLHFALNSLSMFLLPLALLGLVFYLAYVFTGNNSLLVLLIPFYTGVFIVLQYLTFAQMPVGVTTGAWSSALVYAQPTPAGPLTLAIVAALVLPQILGALAYLSLVFRVEDRGQRFRIVVVSVSMLVWMGSAMAVSMGGGAESDWWQLTARFLGLGTAVVVLTVYNPPAILRQRFGVDGGAPDVH